MKVLLSALVLSLFICVHCREPCVHKDFGFGSTVCVCNVTHCDDLDPLKKTPKGVVTVFETSKSGDRFAETTLKFGDKHTDTAKQSLNLTIDRTKKFQKIIGFGGSFTDATGFNIKSLPEKLQNNIIKDYFSTNGLEYNLNRLPIGGSDFSTHGYELDDNHKDDFELKYFNLTSDDFDYKIPYMKAAVEVSPYKIKFFGSPWSAPAWMKNNSEINHGGFLIGEPGGKYYKTFANYFVKFLDAYKANGLPIWGLTIENEPGAGTHLDYSFNSMGFTPELQRDFLKKDLGPILEAAGYGPEVLDVMIFDDQRDQILRWAEIILKDKEAAKYVAGTAFHFYNNKPENAINLDKTRDVDPSKYILATEASHNVVRLGDFNFLEDFAKDILIDLNHWTSGWVGWNMVINMKAGPTWNKSGAGAPLISNNDTEEYYKNPAFYGLGHFSKFIAPDSVKVQLTEGTHLDTVLTAAFERPDGAIALVVLNQGNDPVELNISEADESLSHLIKAHSIQTYIYYN